MSFPSNLAATRDLLHKELIQTQVVRSCLNCECFDKKKGECLEFEMRPPAEVIVFSCGAPWVAELPF
jgi:hypothetical protein